MKTGRPFLASLLLSGWLLMEPPIIEAPPGSAGLGLKIQGGEPVSTWIQVSAYDTAAACEAAKRELVDFAEKQKERDRRVGADSGGRLVYVRATMARCVPADHIYPPRK